MPDELADLGLDLPCDLIVLEMILIIVLNVDCFVRSAHCICEVLCKLNHSVFFFANEDALLAFGELDQELFVLRRLVKSRIEGMLNPLVGMLRSKEPYCEQECGSNKEEGDQGAD